MDSPPLGGLGGAAPLWGVWGENVLYKRIFFDKSQKVKILTFFSSNQVKTTSKSTFFELSKTLVKTSFFPVVQCVRKCRFCWRHCRKLYYISTIYRRFAPKCHLVHIYRTSVRRRCDRADNKKVINFSPFKNRPDRGAPRRGGRFRHL